MFNADVPAGYDRDHLSHRCSCGKKKKKKIHRVYSLVSGITWHNNSPYECGIYFPSIEDRNQESLSKSLPDTTLSVGNYETRP